MREYGDEINFVSWSSNCG